MTERRKAVLFEKFGAAYMPVNLTGWLLLFIYVAFTALSLIVPEILFPDSRIVSGYQIGVFLLFWWGGLRFAKRHST